MSFASQVKTFTVKADKGLDKTIRGTTLALFREVIQRTPVDKGRLRGNWQTTTGSPANGVAARDDKSGALAFAEAIANVGGAGSVTYCTNNLPYAHRIEYDGWSHTKAPEGMVRVSFARINRIIETEAAKHRT